MDGPCERAPDKERSHALRLLAGAPGARLVSSLLLLALPIACGKAGDPQPPRRLTPEAPAELRVAQRGTQIEVTCRAPRASVDGARLGVLDMEVFVSIGEADPAKTARPRVYRVAPGEAISETMQPLPSPGSTVRVAARARLKRRLSAATPVATLTVQAPPPPPAKLTVERGGSGVRLQWKPVRAGAGASGGTRYWVYRRPDDGKYSVALNAEPIADASFSDASSDADAAVCYVVRSVAAIDPIVESDSSPERCLAGRPPAPPAIPRGFLAIPVGGDVELSWSCPAEAGVVAYRVYRADDEAAAQLRAEVAAARCSYRDENVPPGAALKYTLTALNAAGSESAPASTGTLRPRAP